MQSGLRTEGDCQTAHPGTDLLAGERCIPYSMNYRSVVVLGMATKVTGEAGKMTALEALVEHVVPERWNDARHPTQSEVRATSVLKCRSPRHPQRSGAARRRISTPISRFRFGRAYPA